MTERRQKLYYFFRYTIVLTLIALFFTFIPYLEAISEGRKISIWSLLVRNLVSFYCWGALFLPIVWLTRKFNFESKYFYFRNFLIHVVLGVFFSIFHFTGSALIYWLLNPAYRERFPIFMGYLQFLFWGNIFHDLLLYALTVYGIRGYLLRVRYAEEEKVTAQLRSELVQARLQALKMQIQPHFLFNTLNSISSLVLTNPPKAHLMVAQLGDFLRLTLDYSKDQMVTLAEELRFLHSYLEIEQIRFSDRLKADFNVESDVLSAMVPHLVLQPIVENSIKHAVSQRKNGGLVEINADKFQGKLRLQIKDNGNGEEPDALDWKKDEKKDSCGTGLTNVQNRLKHFYDTHASFEMRNSENGGMTITLIIPLNFEFAASRQS